MTDNIHIGYWFSEKKIKKLKLHRFAQLCRQSGVNLVELDLRRPLESQGHFDIIFHKINEEMFIDAENGDADAGDQVANFKRFAASHPELPIVDRLERTLPLRDRRVMFDKLQQTDIVRHSKDVFVPEYMEITSPMNNTDNNRINSSQLKFPCVCKPSDAGNLGNCHDMSLVFNERGLRDVETPCIAQRFINHSGVLHKIFMCGDKKYIVKRPSIKNLVAGDFPTEHFNTHEVSKQDSSSHLNEKDPDISEPDMELMCRIGDSVRTSLGIDLLGIDVIIEEVTGRYGLIDVNPFPGYDGMPDHILETLLEFLVQRAQKFRNNNK